eukprot:gene26622-32171_t
MNNDEERKAFDKDNLMGNFLSSFKNSVGETMVVLYLKMLREKGRILDYTYKNRQQEHGHRKIDGGPKKLTI